jgi:hypothetical protein
MHETIEYITLGEAAGEGGKRGLIRISLFRG